MQNTIIDKDEVEFSRLSMLDEIGRVFTWRNQVYRAINAEGLPGVEKLFSSGLIQRLETLGLIVSSKISDYSLEGYACVIQHETAQVVTYPHEWTFEMLRRAALLVIEINTIAMEYGYQTKDCHPYNVIFFGYQPKFVDIGSLAPVDSGFRQQLYAYNEFCKCYLLPLRVWAGGDAYTARRYLQRWKRMMPLEAYISYKLGGNRGFVRRAIKRLWELSFKLQAIPHFLAASNNSMRSNGRKRVGRLLCDLRFPVHQSRLATLERSVKRLSSPSDSSTWGDYHGRIYGTGDKPALSDRFAKLVDIVAKLGVTTVTDIGGNQGLVSEAIASIPGMKRVICLDSDDVAIDIGYQRSSKSEATSPPMALAVVDPFYPEVNWLEPTPESRFRSELALALAITHHLVLGQGYSLDYVFSIIKSYATKHVVVEFMPLGLFSSITGYGPPIPPWYTQDWFLHEFGRHFSLIDVIPVEQNRVIVVGRIINS